MHTIFAVSSGAAPAAIGIVRVSGPEAMSAARAIAGELPEPRRAAMRTFRGVDGSPIDQGLLIAFPGPQTATGEDLVEFHCHGSVAVLRALGARLAELPGCRSAEPGEFTRRALLNGRIDMTEAEGLGALLSAETESQRRAALRAAEGGTRRLVERWSDQAVDLSASLEAALDHADEADVVSDEAALAKLRAAAVSLAREIADQAALPPVERLHDGIRVVLAGPPNAGKSSLLNALVGRDAAIVSPLAGTTRDRIEVPVQRGGKAFLFTDTAGLTQTPGDAVEAVGVARAEAAIAEADIVLWLDDSPAPSADHMLRIHSRCDVPGRRSAPPGALACSAATGEGLPALWAAIKTRAEALLPPADAVALNQRQRALCVAAADALVAGATEADVLLFAEGLRAARRALDRITGRADVEAVLDSLFARFCIGK